MITTAYSHAHDAFLSVGRTHALGVFDMRVLVALHERGGVGRTDELETELRTADGTCIRRASLTLRHARLIEADAGVDGSRVRRGVRARLTLTDKGERIAEAAIVRASAGAYA